MDILYVYTYTYMRWTLMHIPIFRQEFMERYTKIFSTYPSGGIWSLVWKGDSLIVWFAFSPENVFFKTQEQNLGFPGGAVVKNLPVNAGDMGLIPGLGRSHMPRSN